MWRPGPQHSQRQQLGGCGHTAPATLERVAPLVDLFLFDYKETDPDRHKEFCGVDNRKILANLRILHECEAAIRLRCPIIPGLNDREDHCKWLILCGMCVGA